MIRGFIEVKKHLDELINLIKIMAGHHNYLELRNQPGFIPGNGVQTSTLPCFKNLETLEQEIRDRVSGKSYNISG